MIKKLPLFLILAAHLWLLSKLTFTAWPEMLGYPFLFSHGFALYKDFVYPYPPILIVVLSIVYGVFGYSVVVLKAFTWSLILGGDLVMYLILNKLIEKNFPKWLFLLSFIVTTSFLDGNMLWFDNALVLPLLSGFLFLINWIKFFKTADLFWTALFFSIAADIKQTATLYLIIPLAAILLYGKISRRDWLAYTFGVLSVKVPIFIYLIFNHSISDFLLWLFYYPSAFWTKFPGYVEFSLTRTDILTLILLVVPLGGIVLKGKVSRLLLLPFMFLALSAVTVYPRFSFFHLQPFLAFLAIAYAMIWKFMRVKSRPYQLLGVLSVIVLIAAFSVRKLGPVTRFFSTDQLAEARLIDWYTVFSDRVYLLGLNSSDYVFANRLPPKNWADNFGWYFEIPGVQDKVLSGLRQDPPKLILRRLPNPGNWYEIGVYEPQKIVEYIKENYTKVLSSGQIEVWLRKDARG